MNKKEIINELANFIEQIDELIFRFKIIKTKSQYPKINDETISIFEEIKQKLIKTKKECEKFNEEQARMFSFEMESYANIVKKIIEKNQVQTKEFIQKAFRG